METQNLNICETEKIVLGKNVILNAYTKDNKNISKWKIPPYKLEREDKLMQEEIMK